jgi:hypothetical protein
MESPRPSKRQRRPLIWENAFSKVYLGIYQEKGIPFAKVWENGPAVINPEAARRTAVKQCGEYIKRVSSCQKVRHRSGVYRSPLQRREGSLGYSGSSSSNRRRPQRYVPGKVIFPFSYFLPFLVPSSNEMHPSRSKRSHLHQVRQRDGCLLSRQ